MKMVNNLGYKIKDHFDVLLHSEKDEIIWQTYIIKSQ